MNAFKGLLEPYARITCTCGSEGSGAQQCAPLTRLVSPVLSNIYLSKLDTFAETVLSPQHTRGDRRKENPEYRKEHYRLTQARRKGDRAKAREHQKRVRTLPFGDPSDPGYRRLRYSRYAADHLLGLHGPKRSEERRV